jgi:hypothetical protein
MRKLTKLERAFLGMAAAYVLFVSPSALEDSFMVFRESGAGSVVHLATALGLVLIGFLFLYMAVRGRTPRWRIRSRG